MEKGLIIGQISVGQSHEASFTMDEKRVRAFAEATGDYNPIHFDEKIAQKSVFKARVAQGMLTAGLLSGVFGTQFPGMGTIYLSQQVTFKRPVFLGDQVTVKLTVLEMVPAKNRIRVETKVVNQAGQEVLHGEAWVMPPV